METLATEVFKSLAIPAKPGKYMSIENGPSAVSEPKIRINFKYFAFVITVSVMESFLIFCKGKYLKGESIVRFNKFKLVQKQIA